MTIARKGDLILIERTQHSFYIGAPSTERVVFEYGVVASTTREGIVKTWRSVGWGDGLLSGSAQPVPRPATLRVLSAREIDVMAVIAAAKAHHWPDHPGQPMPFDSLEAAREIARPHWSGVPS